MSSLVWDANILLSNFHPSKLLRTYQRQQKHLIYIIVLALIAAPLPDFASAVLEM
ncbi:hypothetical protein DFH07DRAFT_965790 [Mycena maculata]|uniref:Uncharacterized protein n=1 Tax=Mycena maculata TaxID=230809 RepID=A0AAD7ICL4_9AGAR|nr:hypothetical protein DFH07DRAFT_965790 [Mycena maculata]